MADILIEGGGVITVNSRQEFFARGYVLIDGDRITQVAEGDAPVDVRHQATEIIDASNGVVMPGMVNAHVHLAESITRGLADDKPLMGWLEEAAYPVYRHYTEKEVAVATMVGVIENIRGGSTAVVDNVYVPRDPTSFDAALKVAEEMGIRYKLVRGFVDAGYPDPETLWEDPEEVIRETRRLYETWHGQANGRLRVDFGPNNHWAVSESTIIKISELAQEWGIGIHTHTAESREELDLMLETRGKRHLEWLADLGILGPHFQLAHCVWVDDREIEQIAESGAVVVHNPASNAFLSAGVAPVLKMRQAGVHVALGTDGQAVNIGQEMLDVLKWALNLQKISSLDPLALSPEDVIYMACQEGAAAFGQPELIGSLEAGKKADLIIVDMNNPRLTLPSLSVPSLLVNFSRGTDVDTVIVDGKILMRNKKILTVDEDALLAEFRELRKDLLVKAGVITA